MCQCRPDTTTNASFVDTGFLALLEITIITVTLLAHYSLIVAAFDWTDTRLFRLNENPQAHKILLDFRCCLYI